jgi:hypothetical protein
MARVTPGGGSTVERVNRETVNRNAGGAVVRYAQPPGRARGWEECRLCRTLTGTQISADIGRARGWEECRLCRTLTGTQISTKISDQTCVVNSLSLTHSPTQSLSLTHSPTQSPSHPPTERDKFAFNYVHWDMLGPFHISTNVR